MKRIENLAVVEAIIAIVLWGISFIVMKIVLREISAVTLIVLRYAIGALGVGLFAWQRGDWARLTYADLPGLALTGAVGITLQQLLQVSGQVTANASVAAFLAATAPAFTVILAAVWLREPLRGGQIVGVGLASAGGVLVATGGDWAALFSGRAMQTLPGNLLIWLSAIVWAIFIILSKKVVHQRPAALVTAGLFFFGMLFTLPLFLAQQAWREIPRLSLGGWGGVLFVGLLTTAVAYLLNNHALKYVSASRVAVIQNIEPLSAVIGAALFLREPITGIMLLGGLAIMSGVYLAERNAAQPAPPDAGPIAQTLT